MKSDDNTYRVQSFLFQRDLSILNLQRCKNKLFGFDLKCIHSNETEIP